MMKLKLQKAPLLLEIPKKISTILINLQKGPYYNSKDLLAISATIWAFLAIFNNPGVYCAKFQIITRHLIKSNN